jgi:hypothetical protein
MDLKILMSYRTSEVKGRSTHFYESLTFAPGIGHPLSHRLKNPKKRSHAKAQSREGKTKPGIAAKERKERKKRTEIAAKKRKKQNHKMLSEGF